MSSVFFCSLKTIDRFKKFARLGTILLISDAIISISATMRGKHTSDDLAKLIYRLKDANTDYANSAIARFFSISESTLRGILKRRIGRSDRQNKINWIKCPTSHEAMAFAQRYSRSGLAHIFSRFEPYRTLWGLAIFLKRSRDGTKTDRTKYSLFKIVILGEQKKTEFANKTLKIFHFKCQSSSQNEIKCIT